jgi:drug/metabolite transporter (DMT)-like permease
MSCSAAGLALLCGAVVSSTAYRTALEDLTSRHEPLLISTWFFLINGTLVSIVLLPFVGPIPVTALGIGIWIGITGALANVAFVAAVSLIGSTRMSIINMLQRPLIITTAAVVLGEPFSALQAVGVAMVVWGVQLARVKRTSA